MESLERFIDAQDATVCGYAQALSEMQAGGKQSHWIWYIFPQTGGLGRSGMSKYYSIQGLLEADAYIKHPILGVRLREITNVVLNYPADAKAEVFMGSKIDALKLQSCMTLFDIVAPNDIFKQVIDKFYGGELDSKTLAFRCCR